MLFQLVVCLWVLSARCLAQDAEIIAALVGQTETVRFNCSAEVGSDILEWRWFPTLGESGQRMWISGDPIKPEYLNLSQPTRFPTTHLADNSRHQIEIYQNNFDLIIHNVRTDDAATYVCRLLLQDTDSHAYLVFVQGFSCGSGRPNASNVDVAEGDTMPLLCSVQSYGPLTPTLNWTLESGTDISAVYSVVGENVTLSAEMRATVELNQKPFTCHLAFQPHKSLSPDSKLATYSDSCVFSYNVWYKPRNVQSSRPASADGILSLKPGDTVSCSSSGNPQPTNFWLKQGSVEGTGQVKDSMLTITANMISSVPVPWFCRATNSFNGQTFTDEIILYINVSSPPPTTSTTPTLTQPPRTTTRLPPQPTLQPTPQPTPQPTVQPTPQPTPAASSTAESLPNNTAQAQTGGGGGNGAVIGGAVAGVLVVIILLAAAAAYFFYSRRKGKDADKEDLLTPRDSSRTRQQWWKFLHKVG